MSMIKGYFSLNTPEANALLQNPDILLDWMEDEEIDYPYLEIDKAWHGLHYLLTGTAWEGNAPWTYLVLAGHPVGEDLGYGPALFLTPELVSEAADAIAGLDETTLRQRYNPEEMMRLEINPEVWVEEGEEGLQYLLHFYGPLKEFFQTAASNGHSIVHYMS